MTKRCLPDICECSHSFWEHGDDKCDGLWCNCDYFIQKNLGKI